MTRGVRIPGWRERVGISPDFKLYYPTAVEQAMLDEIAELRKLLRVPDESVERLVDPRQLDLIEGVMDGSENTAAEP